MPKPIEELAQEVFPIITSCSYLNTPSSGLISKRVLDFRNNYNKSIFEDYSKIDYLEDEKIEVVRSKIKTYFNAENAEVALLPNFSTGMNYIAEAIPEGAKVLLLEGDYPSVNLAFTHRNLNIDYAKIDAQLEANILQKVELFKPDFLALSLVQFISGMLIDFDFLKELKSQYPALHIIGDATQYLGTASFHFDQSPFSVIGTSGYKWFHAGTGNAFFMLKKDILNTLRPASLGSNSLLTKPDGPTRKIGFMEPGHFDMHAFQSLEVALDFHYKEVGIKRIEQKINKIIATAKEEFTKHQLIEEDVINRKKHSAIFNIKGKNDDLERLLNQKVVCAKRGDGIRVGFQYFNNNSDLEKTIDALTNKNKK